MAAQLARSQVVLSSIELVFMDMDNLGFHDFLIYLNINKSSKSFLNSLHLFEKETFETLDSCHTLHDQLASGL
jgi:hypothetical protein